MRNVAPPGKPPNKREKNPAGASWNKQARALAEEQSGRAREKAAEAGPIETRAKNIRAKQAR
ncbi:MAG: hypothetical protein ACREEM_36570 [Blastocatellia bacterium]